MSDKKEQGSVLVFRPSWKNYIPHYLGIAAIIAALVVLKVKFDMSAFWGNVLYVIGTVGVLFILGKVALTRFGERFSVRKDEVHMEHGILNKHSIEVGLLQIRTMQVNQNIWQRLMNIGNLLIASAGTEGYEIIAHGIDNPYRLRDTIQEKIRAEAVPVEVEKNSD